jgi:hypothetical protein
MDTAALGRIQSCGPVADGRLAGAIVTFLLNQRSSRRKQPRLIVATQRVDYSISSKDETLKDLCVSYGGKAIDALAFFQLDVDPVSADREEFTTSSSHGERCNNG